MRRRERPLGASLRPLLRACEPERANLSSGGKRDHTLPYVVTLLTPVYRPDTLNYLARIPGLFSPSVTVMT